jgi:hypothetical protein
MAGFSVNIGANIAPLSAGLQQATAEVQKFSDVVATAAPTASLTTLNNVISVTAHQFDELAASAAALAKIEAAIDQAAEAATNAGARFDTLGGRLPLQEFNTFKASVDRLKADISGGLVPQISRIPAALNPITPAANNAAAALSKIRPGANQAANALQGVGRVAQDLPFGFIGIQNNLNPLLESFQRLRAETGSSKAALSALGSSLIGAGGIGLALSVVSSAILIYQNGIAGFNSKTKEAADKTKEAADKLKEFLRTLKSVAEVTDTAVAGQTGNIAQVQALANVVRDTTASYDERKRALQDLQQVNKNYFGDLKLEENQMALLTDRVNEYSKAIIAQAVLKGFTDEISRVSLELSNQDRALKKTSEQLGRAKKALEDTGLNDVTARQGTVQATKNYIALQQEIKKLEPVYKAQRDVVEQLQTNYALLNGQIDEATRNTLKLRDLNNPGGQKQEVDFLKKRLEALEKIKALTKDATALVGIQESIFELQVKIAVRDQGKNQITKSELDQQIKGFQAELQKAFDNQALELEAIPKVKFSETSRLAINDIIGKLFTSKEKIILTIGENGVKVNVKQESVDISDLKDKVSKATGFDKKIPIKTQFEIDVQFLGLKGAQLKKAKEDVEMKLSETIAQIKFNGKIDLATQIGDVIGESLASRDFGEGFKKAARGILSIIGDVMQQIGKQVITAALAIKALKTTLEKFAITNPALAVVAGIGLIAAGAALKNIKFDGPKFAAGGIVTGPIIGQIGEMHRSEVILPLDRLPQMLKSMGGSAGGDMQLIPIINNEGLYLAVQRGGRRVNRKN